MHERAHIPVSAYLDRIETAREELAEKYDLKRQQTHDLRTRYPHTQYDIDRPQLYYPVTTQRFREWGETSRLEFQRRFENYERGIELNSQIDRQQSEISLANTGIFWIALATFVNERHPDEPLVNKAVAVAMGTAMVAASYYLSQKRMRTHES